MIFESFIEQLHVQWDTSCSVDRLVLALLAAQDATMVKPLWPSLLQGPVFIDHPSGQPQKAGEEYIMWDN